VTHSSGTCRHCETKGKRLSRILEWQILDRGGTTLG
jgi:hypothetical protein